MAKRLILGQTLLEAVFVVSIVGLILSGLVFGIIYFSRASRSATDRSLAVNLVQDKMEELRALKVNDAIGFWADAEASRVTTETPVTGTGNPTQFARVTEFSGYQLFPNTRRVKVMVTVSWHDGSETREVNAQSYFASLD